MFFSVKQITDFNLYNKYIMYDKNSTRDIHMISEDEEGITYPFYIIFPLITPGLCISYEEDKIALKPLRKDNPNQKFKVVSSSNYCN